MGEDGKISWCYERDNMLGKLFDGIYGLLLPSSEMASKSLRSML